MMRHLSSAGRSGRGRSGLIRKGSADDDRPFGVRIGTGDSVKTGTAYRLLSSDGLRVQVVPLAHWILSRLTSP
jgi:hypothetical protein